MTDALTLLLLAVAGLFAGFVDAIVGGGGVITLPSFLAAGLSPHQAVATNKVAGTAASSMASWQWMRAGLVDLRLAGVAFPFSVAAGVAGAATVLRLPGDIVLVLIAVALAAMVTYMLVRPRFGQEDRYPGPTRATLVKGASLALAVGFYDGVLGPGTGNLLLFGLVSILGMPFLRAAAQGRVLNFGSNVGALAYFVAADAVLWAPGLAMAAGTLTGAFAGSRFGIRHGARWIRPLFLVVAAALLVRLLLS